MQIISNAATSSGGRAAQEAIITFSSAETDVPKWAFRDLRQLRGMLRQATTKYKTRPYQ